MNQANNIELAADIVSAYVSNNSVAANDLPRLIADVHQALARTHEGTIEPEPEPLFDSEFAPESEPGPMTEPIEFPEREPSADNGTESRSEFTLPEPEPEPELEQRPPPPPAPDLEDLEDLMIVDDDIGPPAER